MNIMHLLYIISILFSNKLYEKIIFYLIFLLSNSNIEYKYKIITKLYIYLNCYKNNINYLQLILLTSIVNEEYEKGMAFASIVYYLYTDIITNINIFWYKIMIIYLYIGSNTKLKIVYNTHFKLYVNYNINNLISLNDYMKLVDYMKHILICVL
jgi:hypothetical protein